MSDRYTEVRAGGAGYGMWGHVPHADAVAAFRRVYEYNLAEAQKALAALDAGDDVHVYHQLGPWAARNRREVTS